MPFLTYLDPASTDSADHVEREVDVAWLRQSLLGFLQAPDKSRGRAVAILGERGAGKSALAHKVVDELRELHAATTLFLIVDCRKHRNQRKIYHAIAVEAIKQLGYRSDVDQSMLATARLLETIALMDTVKQATVYERISTFKQAAQLNGSRSLLNYLGVSFEINIERSAKNLDSLEGSIHFDGSRLLDAVVAFFEDLRAHQGLDAVVVLDNLDELRGELRRCIASSGDGTLSTLDDPREVDELVRLGLAHREQGDAILVPLARKATEQGVVELLDLEGITTPDSLVLDDAVPVRSRATSPTEAIIAFDPLTPISASPEDPWFVDLRPLAPSLQDFSKRFRQQLARRDRRVRLAVLQQSGGGASTLIRQLVHELQSAGVICVGVRAPVHARFGFVDLLLRTMSALLTHAEEQSNLSGPPEALEQLRRWLGEHCLEGELREYVRLGADIMEQARIPSLLMILQRAHGAGHGAGPESPERARVRLALEARVDEMLEQLGRILTSLRAQLSARGLQLCLHYENTAGLDAKTIDEVFVAHADDLAPLDCHLLFGVDPSCEYLPTNRAVSEVFTTLSYPSLLATPEVWRAVVQAVLAARGQLDAIFERPDDAITRIAAHANGSLRRALELAVRACEHAATGLVDDDALLAAVVAQVLAHEPAPVNS
ncbi:hypothetical protein DB30_00892 [Enhygromyxa salina]|uniref:Orc1-like AAA ATPase domain-containing protein n=1 Tax=Enhygromyxa salina TaxID=215803 RepID=A0A0C2CNX6_9BACT|nr:AAA family ATPase [Enhygromyxa salina]KIG12936.1 hypothetical protein DB30_00892 [Enhygromyxa salina]